MITEMFMPKNGMDMTEGTIIKWLKNIGDKVEADEPIMEIETDKITMEAEAPGSGILLKKLYNDGDTVPVLTVIGYIGDANDAVPEGGDDVSESVDTHAATNEQLAPVGDSNEKAPVAATPLARAMASDKGISLNCIAPSGSREQILSRDVIAAANSTGVARAIAAENGEKLNQISGSGERGRVTKDDLSGENKHDDAQPDSHKVEVFSEHRKLTAMRKVIAKRMLESHTNIPTVTQNTLVDVTKLMALRKELNEEKGSRISVNDFIIRAVAMSLPDHERVCMQFMGSEYTLLKKINVGVAVSTDDGLLVPVIRDADCLTLTEISASAKDIAAKARDGKLSKDELGDARITITNLGMFGVHSFTPIINEPECAILGVCAAEEYLSFNEKDEIERRKRMMLCLTYDHRILNGTEAAAFSNQIKNLLEHPFGLLS